MAKKFEVWEQEPTKETTTSIADDFNQSNCITVQKSKIKDLEKENLQLHEDLDYYKTKSGSCEEGLFQKDREIAKLKQENKQLEKTISHYADISALSVEILNEEEEVINDYARIVCNDAEELIKENEQLKSEIRKQSKQCTASIQRFKEENEQLKQEIEELKVDLKMAKIDGAIDRMAQRPMRW